MKKRTRYIFIGSFALLSYLFLKETVATFFTHRHNNAVLADIKTVNIQSYTQFSDFINAIENETDWHIVIRSGYRTIEEQEALKDEDARNAAAGHSKHNFGKAIDINLYRNTWLASIWVMKSSPKRRWENTGILTIAKRHKLKWGGNFRRYYDPVHFEVE